MKTAFETLWLKESVENPFKDEVGEGKYSPCSIAVRNRKMAAKIMFLKGVSVGKESSKEVEVLKKEIEELKKKTGYTTSLFSSTCNNCGHMDRE